MIRTPDQLLKLQKWAKKAKKEKPVENTVTSFKKIYYSFSRPIRSQGSGKKLYDKNYSVQFVSFTFLGLEIQIESDNNSKYQFPETEFNSTHIWINRNIMYGGTEYYPKEKLTEYFGFDFEIMFLNYLKIKEYFVLKIEGRTGNLKYYLCNESNNARKLLHGRRLNSFDNCNRPVVKLSHENALYVSKHIPTKAYHDFIIPISIADMDDKL